MLQKKHPAADFVFHRSDGARWTDIHDSFQALVRRCGLDAEPPFNITLHTLRHTFGSWAAISGASMRAIQKLMGHNSIVTTERYAHLSADSLAAVARNVGAFVTNPVTAFPKSNKIALPGKSSSDLESWCPGRESNSHVPLGTRDFKSQLCDSCPFRSSLQEIEDERDVHK